MGTIELSLNDAGVLLPVHAQPGARRNGVVGVHDGRLKVAVTQIAEGGKANRKLRQVLAQSLGLKPSQVTLQVGEQSSRKTFLLSEITQAELQQRLERCLADRPAIVRK